LFGLREKNGGDAEERDIGVWGDMEEQILDEAEGGSAAGADFMPATSGRVRNFQPSLSVLLFLPTSCNSAF
jgi:hypothetical protein